MPSYNPQGSVQNILNRGRNTPMTDQEKAQLKREKWDQRLSDCFSVNYGMPIPQGREDITDTIEAGFRDNTQITVVAKNLANILGYKKR